ncbi:esterase/lipase [Cadophora sp. DSE1049]|nr:esterase/lipase [Cadophora sp. DSE1049]
MASHAPAACCLQGFRHEGESKGTIEILADFEVYIAHPAEKSELRGLLFFSDVLGHSFINSQILADQFAAQGFLVMLPDLFYGDSLPLTPNPGLDIMKWAAGEYNEKKIPHNPSTVDPIVEKCITELREKYKCQTVAAVGYCFGAKYVIRNLKLSSQKVDVGFIAHPSFVDNKEVELIRAPLAIAAAETNRVFPAEKRHETEAILMGLGLPYQLNLYSGVEHGFALRGDLTKPVQKYAKESAFALACHWFEAHT